jgi:hypothetical protein
MLPPVVTGHHEPHERADHEDLAVGQMQHAQHAEDQRVPDRDERVHRAQHDAVDQLLEQHR